MLPRSSGNSHLSTNMIKEIFLKRERKDECVHWHEKGTKKKKRNTHTHTHTYRVPGKFILRWLCAVCVPSKHLMDYTPYQIPSRDLTIPNRRAHREGIQALCKEKLTISSLQGQWGSMEAPRGTPSEASEHKVGQAQYAQRKPARGQVLPAVLQTGSRKVVERCVLSVCKLTENLAQ